MTDKKNWKKFREETALHEEDEVIDNSTPSTEGDAPVGLDHPSYVELEEKLTLAEQTSHENWEKAVRAMAELDNVRRRSEREVTNAHRYGAEKLISSLLPVYDSLEQAMQLAFQQEDKGLHEGLVLTMKLFTDALSKCDVTFVDPTGEMFDPQQHEAMSILPSADVAPNTVLTVFQKGCVLNDRVIRPARVIVAKAIN
jgi:molecular chaperone GrpE